MTKAVIPPCFAPGTTSARFSKIRQHTVDLGGSDLHDTIISCIVYFRSWLSARLSVATKRTRSGHGQSLCWPRMLDCVDLSKETHSARFVARLKGQSACGRIYPIEI